MTSHKPPQIGRFFCSFFLSSELYPYFPQISSRKLYTLTWKGWKNMDYLDWIPDRIAELRLQKGVSARDMSLSLGQSASYVNKIENRRTLPSMEGFLYICEYFGITPQDFFNRESAARFLSPDIIRHGP